MKSFISKYFLQLITLGVIIFMLFKSCNKSRIEYKDKIVLKTDTTWIYNNNTVITNPQIVKTIRDTIEKNTIEYRASENYNLLKEQYIQLRDEFLSKNIIKDSIQIDSLGRLSIIDTVSKNKIVGRYYSYNFKYPIVTNTVTMTKYQKPKNQVYFGGSLSGNSENVINQIDVGFFFKNKKDQIIGLKTGFDINGNWNIGIQSYFKIKLK